MFAVRTHKETILHAIGDGGGCCGNTCYGKGSKCCKVGHPNEWYPVSKDTECKSRKSHKTCKNRFGEEFWCAPEDKCCGDICVSKLASAARMRMGTILHA